MGLSFLQLLSSFLLVPIQMLHKEAKSARGLRYRHKQYSSRSITQAETERKVEVPNSLALAQRLLLCRALGHGLGLRLLPFITLPIRAMRPTSDRRRLRVYFLLLMRGMPPR